MYRPWRDGESERHALRVVFRKAGCVRQEAAPLCPGSAPTTWGITHSTNLNFELAGRATLAEEKMGDRSPKSKQRDQKQKDAAKAKDKAKKTSATEAGRVPIAKK